MATRVHNKLGQLTLGPYTDLIPNMTPTRGLLSGRLILYWGGVPEGGWICPSPKLGKLQLSSRGGGGGGSALLGGWVGGLLSLVDRKHCPWAEAHFEA